MKSRAESTDRSAAARRARYKYTRQQTEKLERLFDHSRYPDTDSQEKLALDLGISTERIAIWFQNRRSKFKRQRQSDHMIWMREQIFKTGDTASPTRTSCLPPLPEMGPGCHVLSPLTSQLPPRGDCGWGQQTWSPATPVSTRVHKHSPLEMTDYVIRESILLNQPIPNATFCMQPGQTSDQKKFPTHNQSTHQTSCLSSFDDRINKLPAAARKFPEESFGLEWKTPVQCNTHPTANISMTSYSPNSAIRQPELSSGPGDIGVFFENEQPLAALSRDLSEVPDILSEVSASGPQLCLGDIVGPECNVMGLSLNENIINWPYQW